MSALTPNTRITSSIRITHSRKQHACTRRWRNFSVGYHSINIHTTITYRWNLALMFLCCCAFVRDEVEERTDGALWSFSHFLLLLCQFGLGHLALEALAAQAGAATGCRTTNDRSALATLARPALATTRSPHVAFLRTPAAAASRPADRTRRHSQQTDETLVENVM